MFYQETSGGFIHILAVHVLTVVCAYMDARLLSVYRKLSSYNTRNGVLVKKRYCKLFWESMLAYSTIPSKRLALPCSSMDNNHPELSFHTQNGLTINEN